MNHGKFIRNTLSDSLKLNDIFTEYDRALTCTVQRSELRRREGVPLWMLLPYLLSGCKCSCFNLVNIRLLPPQNTVHCSLRLDMNCTLLSD